MPTLSPCSLDARAHGQDGVAARLPEELRPLANVALDLWWSWQPGAADPRLPLCLPRRQPTRGAPHLHQPHARDGARRLWHGTAYTFIVWGGLHGAALAVERLLGLHQDRGLGRFVAVRCGWFLVVQGVVLTAWIFFRSRSVQEAGYILRNIALLDQWALGSMELVGLLFLAPIVILHTHTWLTERGLVMPPRPAFRAVLAAGMVYAIATLYAGTADFIYFQF